MAQRAYDNKKRKEVATTYKVGQTVNYKGQVYDVKAVDAYETEVLLAIELQNAGCSFIIIDSRELADG